MLLHSLNISGSGFLRPTSLAGERTYIAILMQKSTPIEMRAPGSGSDDGSRPSTD